MRNQLFGVVALAATLCLVIITVLSASARAQDVSLYSSDGLIRVDGTLIAFDGEFLRLETEFGQLTLDAQGLSCAGPGCPLLTDAAIEARLEGAGVTLTRLVPSVVAAFAQRERLELTSHIEEGDQILTLVDPMRQAPRMRLRLRVSSSDQGLVSLVMGETDIALTLSPIQDPDLFVHVLALDAHVPVVHPDSPILSLSMEDLRAVLSGEVTQWEFLGHDSVPITLHLRDLASGEGHGLASRLFEAGIEVLREDAIHHASSDELVQAVARDPFALGLVLRSAVNGLRVLDLSEGCGIPISADPFMLKTDDFPLTQPLYAVQLQHRLPLRLRHLLEFFTSSAATEAIRNAGFVETDITTRDLPQQGARLANAILSGAQADADDTFSELQRLTALMRAGRQISMSFRFEPGTSHLDSHSRANIRHLARQIEAGALDQSRIVLIGFTDGEGSVAANRALSLARAQVVRTALLEAAPLRDVAQSLVDVAGFGALSPLACDDSEWGRAANRRVEVWLLPMLQE